VLKGVSFEIKPGQSVAIVGPSGSGKSTIVKLLLRMYDPNEGQMSIDGVDVKDLTQQSLRSAVAVVPQDTVSRPVSLLAFLKVVSLKYSAGSSKAQVWTHES
jgi:ABC-type multidrug transport system fused ATPase/permease subunit